MIVETFQIGEIKLDPENERLHPDENIEAIVRSLDRFGQILPLVVWEDIVIGGNGTLIAMRQLGFSDVKVVRFEGAKEQARALALALNRTAELAVWDLPRLAQSLVNLEDFGFCPDDLGFSPDALDFMFPPEKIKEPRKPKELVSHGEGMRLMAVCPECGHKFTPSGDLDK